MILALLVSCDSPEEGETECAHDPVEDEAVKNTRLMLADAVKCVLGNAFGLVCIKKTEKI